MVNKKPAYLYPQFDREVRWSNSRQLSWMSIAPDAKGFAEFESLQGHERPDLLKQPGFFVFCRAVFIDGVP